MKSPKIVVVVTDVKLYINQIFETNNCVRWAQAKRGDTYM